MAKRYKKQFKTARKFKRKMTGMGGVRAFTGQIVTRKIEYSVPVYLRTTGGYSFATDDSYITRDLFSSTDFPNVGFYSDEFNNLRRSYSYFKITGYKLRWSRVCLLNSIDLIAPPLSVSVALTGGSISSLSQYSDDTAFRIQPIGTDTKPPSRYYAFPSMLVDTSYRPTFGCWLGTGINVDTMLFSLALGWQGQGLTELTTQVGNLDCVLYVKFMRPHGTLFPS